MLKLLADGRKVIGGNESDALGNPMQQRAKVINVDFSKPRELEIGGLKGKVRNALASLNPVSQEVLTEMFGLRDGMIRSVCEVSHRSGLAPEDVENISAQALRDLFFRKDRKSKGN